MANKVTPTIPGQKFGRLTVLKRAENNPGQQGVRWLCQCECGNVKSIQAGKILNGQTKSCGCFQRERMVNMNRRHGMFGTRIYRIWTRMMTRCTNQKARNYADYGGRGIRVCERWKKFENFYADMIGTYRDGLSIDRIDPNGDYYPENCRWETATRQQRNRRITKILEFNGRRQSIADWADELAIPLGTLRERLRRGWTTERALTTKVIRPRTPPESASTPRPGGTP